MKSPDQPAPPRPTRTRAGGRSHPVEIAEMIGLIESDQPRDAIRHARKLLALDPRHIPALEVVAKGQWALGQFDEVIQTATHLLRLNPNEPGYRILQAMALQSLGRFAVAVKVLQQSLIEHDQDEAKARAREMIEELESIQAQAVKVIRTTDPLFAQEYAADPEQACRSRGFEFSWYAESQPNTLEADRQVGASSFGRA